MVAAHTNDLLAAAAMRTAHRAHRATQRARAGHGRSRAEGAGRCRGGQPGGFWLPGSRHEVAAGRRHRARHRSNPGLGHLVLFSRRAGRADRRGYRLVAGLGGRRHVDRPAGRRADRAAGGRHHRAQRRPAGARRELAALCGRARRHRACSDAAGLSRWPGSCSAAAWAPASTTRCSPRSASSTARRRARRSPISRCSAASPARCAGR